MKKSFILTAALFLAIPLYMSCDEEKSSDDKSGNEAFCREMGTEMCKGNLDLCDPAWCGESPSPERCASLSNDEACNDSQCADYCDCSEYTDAQCSSHSVCVANNKCAASDPCADYISCEVGETQCNGGTESLIACVRTKTGCTKWDASNVVKKCDSTPATPYCVNGTCVESKNICLPANGSNAKVVNVTDGDTFRLLVTGKDGDDCIPSIYSVRIHGIDAPECEKRQNEEGYYSCVKSTRYGVYLGSDGSYVTNDPYGYEAMEEAIRLAPKGSIVKLGCDKNESDGGCEIDDTEARRLVYLSVTANGMTYDFSTEMARSGAAFANTKFYNNTSKIKAICSAMGEAQKSNAGMWTKGKSIKQVINAIYGKSWLDSMQKKCGLKY